MHVLQLLRVIQLPRPAWLQGVQHGMCGALGVAQSISPKESQMGWEQSTQPRTRCSRILHLYLMIGLLMGKLAPMKVCESKDTSK
jgi:uncharacterized membrane protein